MPGKVGQGGCPGEMKLMDKIRDFRDKERNSKLPEIDAFCRRAFEWFVPAYKQVTIKSIDTKQKQLLGIDYEVEINIDKTNDKRIEYIDLKLREEVPPGYKSDDIGLEYKHTTDFQGVNILQVGWIEKQVLTDWIFYLFYTHEKQVGYFLPFLSLQHAWFENKPHWVKAYCTLPAKNRTYFSWNCFVPIIQLRGLISLSTEYTE